MADKRSNIETPSVEKLIPQQLVGNSTALIEFLKEYYRFLNQENEPVDVVNTIIQNKDLDDAVDTYIDMVRKELGYGMARELEANKINLYKHIGEFYRAKGSIDSFKLLFRLLFNKNVEISLPKEQILVASDGRWVQQTSLFTEVTSGTAFDLVNTFVDIVNTDGSTVRVEVERVRHYQNEVYEIVVSRFFVGTINNNATFNSNGVIGTVINSLSGFTIDYPGKKFKVGQLLDVVYGTSVGTKIKVTSVNTDGGITGLEFLSFGVNYPENFTSQLVPVGFDYFFNVTETTPGDPSALTYTGSLNDQVGSTEYIYLEINPYCFGFDELQADGTQYAAADYFSETYTEGLEFVRITDDKYFAEAYLEGQRAIGSPNQVGEDDSDVSQQHIKDTDPDALVTLQSLYPNRAIITFENTPLSKYAGAYSTNKGFLSDDIYLQDNLYYQQFSYVIKTDEQFSNYEGIVKQTVHPSGMAVFGEFEITTELDASSVIALLATLFRTDFSDVVQTFENLFERTIIKATPLDDERVFTSQFVYYEFTKPLEDEVLTPDEDSYELTKVEVDEIFSTEAIQKFDITKPLIDEVIAEDSSLFEDPLVAYSLDYFRQDYSEGLFFDITNGFSWELTKPFVETIITSQTVDYEFGKIEVDEIITSQTVDYNMTKPLSHIVDTQNEDYSTVFTKPLEDISVIYSEKYTNPAIKDDLYAECDLSTDEHLDDYFLEDYTVGINIPLFDITFTKSLVDTQTTFDPGIDNFVFTKAPSDEAITSQTVDYVFTKSLADTVITDDTDLNILRSQNQSDSTTSSDTTDYSFTKISEDSVTTSDIDDITFTKASSDTVNTVDDGIEDIEFTKNITDDVAISEDRYYTNTAAELYVATENMPDSDYPDPDGYFAEYYVENINEPLLEKAITKPLLDSINNITEGGRVQLNPYATVHFFDGYFAEDYIEGSRAIS
jgi:hypothetical protein